ncbi:hypothetical protein D9M71_195230 [compost metagenome]
MAAQDDTVRSQAFGHRAITPDLVDAIFLVHLHRADIEIAAEVAHYTRRIGPGIGLADQQRHVQPIERPGQLRQVAQPEVHLGRRVVMGPPLAGADEVEGDGRTGGEGSVQGCVVLNT